MKCLKVLVFGEVQGVGFRRYVWHLAKRMNLEGYVKNLSDGSVEIVIKGDSTKIDEFLNKLSSVRVFTITNVIINELPECSSFNDFNIVGGDFK